MIAYCSYRLQNNLLDNIFILMCDKFNYTYHKILGNRMEICHGTIEEILADDTIPKQKKNHIQHKHLNMATDMHKYHDQATTKAEHNNTSTIETSTTDKVVEVKDDENGGGCSNQHQRRFR